MPMPRRKPELGVGLGPSVVPYSRNNEENPLVSMLDPSKQQEALAFLGQNQGAGDEESMAPPPQEGAPPPAELGAGMGEMGGDPGTPDSSMLSDVDLQAMQPNQAAPQGGQDPQVAAVIAALQNPDTPPEMKQRIETMLSLSARRRLAGLNS